MLNMANSWYFLPFIWVYKIVFFILCLPYYIIKTLGILLKIIFKHLFIISKDVFKHIFVALHYLFGGFTKYLVNGLKVTFMFVSKIFVKIFAFIFRIVKYFFYSFVIFGSTISSLLFNIRLSRDLKNYIKRENEREKKILKAKQEALDRKNQELRKQQKREEIELKKQQKKNDKLKRKEQQQANLEKNEYINENVVIEKKTLSEKFKLLLLAIAGIPAYILNGTKKKFKNATLTKSLDKKKELERQALYINFEGEDAIKSAKKVVYQYVAKDLDGKIVKDYFEAYSKVEVHSFLLSEGYEVYSIKTSKWINTFYTQSNITNVKIKIKDLIFFLTQLSTYIKVGIPLADAMKILSKQFKNKKYKKIFKNVIYNLNTGDVFSEALNKQGKAFPQLLINMIKTAEMTGELPEALDDMTDYYTEVNKTKKQMITALMYPMMVFVLATAVIVFILMWVVPQFVEIYNSMDAEEIPAFTVFVINASGFLKGNAIPIAVITVMIVIVLILLYKNSKIIRAMMQTFYMHIPVLGTVVIYNEVTMFTKTFASLLKHNVFITDSMEILNKITNNEVYKLLILDTITNIAHGDKISMAFENQWAFPMPAYEMLVTGEKTGQLPDMMSKVSKYYQELHVQSVTRIKTFIEPLLIIFLTTVVGGIVLAIILPMFGMYEMVM